MIIFFQQQILADDNVAFSAYIPFYNSLLYFFFREIWLVFLLRP